MDIQVDFSDLAMNLKGDLENVQKQINFATMRALNAGAYKASKDTAREIEQVFKSPTPWVMSSIRYRKATKEKLESRVDFDGWGNKQGVTVSQVLRAEIEGGERRLKRHEIALQRAGVLPAGMAIVPGPASQKDSYGNMPVSQINQIMSYFQAFGQQGYSANMRDGGKRLARGNKKSGARGFVYFVLQKPHGKLHAGVYQRVSFGGLGSAIKPIMYFVPMPRYRKAFAFYTIAYQSGREEFNKQYPVMLREAFRTAR